VIPLHQGEDIGRGLLLKILRGVGLTREEFLAIEK
jgi:predicted RNA binding protein YcfA (HicA-like mRNA interferase family)